MELHELIRLLRTAETAEQIDEKRDEIADLIPEVKTMFGYDQKRRSQCFDLWMHSVNTVVLLPKDLPEDEPNDLLYLAALLHDIGKPETAVPDKKNPEYMTYKGHEQTGVKILKEKILPRLAAGNEAVTKSGEACLKYYISMHHDQALRVKRFARKHLMMATLEQFENLMKLQIADCKAQYKCADTEQRVSFSEHILKKANDDVTGLFMFSKWLQ